MPSMPMSAISEEQATAPGQGRRPRQQRDDTGVAKGVNRAARSRRIGRFVNEEILRSDLAAEKSERPRDYMTAGYLSDTSGL
jgi:hypothetical protein